MFGLFVAATIVLAEPDPIATSLSWEAPASCPTATQIADAVAQASPETEFDVSGQARVEVDGDAYRLDLSITVDGDSATRSFRDPSCATLANAAVLSIAIARDPSTANIGLIDWSTVEPQPAPSPEPTAEREPERVTAPQRTPQPQPKPRIVALGCGTAKAHQPAQTSAVPCVEFEGAGGASVGVVTQTALSAGLGLSLLWARAGLAARAETTPRLSARTDSVGVEVRSSVVGVDALIRRRLGRHWEVDPYLGVGVALHAARGFGFDTNNHPIQPVVRARTGARLGLSTSQGFFGVRAQLNASPGVDFRAASGRLLASTGVIGADFALVAAVRLRPRTRVAAQ